MKAYVLNESVLEALAQRGVFLNPRWFESHRTVPIATDYGSIHVSVHPSVPDDAILAVDSSPIREFNARHAAREQ